MARVGGRNVEFTPALSCNPIEQANRSQRLQWFETVCKSGPIRRSSDGPSRGIQSARRPLAAPQTRRNVLSDWKAALRRSALNLRSGAVVPGARSVDEGLPRLPISAIGLGAFLRAVKTRQTQLWTTCWIAACQGRWTDPFALRQGRGRQEILGNLFRQNSKLT
jgi:hypothetical protein